MSLLLRKFHSSCIVLLCFSLHSTMSLLLLCRSEYVKALTVLYIPLCLYYYGTFSALWQLLSSFTFHYVSITTRDGHYRQSRHSALHSTMSLLLPVLSTEIIEAMCLFTFHYVSITTVTANNYFKVNTDFTFHYVSITTQYTDDRNYNALLFFTFHYVSITTRTSQSPTLQSQFYHFLSTLSFSPELPQNFPKEETVSLF